MTVNDILNIKGSDVFTIDTNKSVFDAMKILVENKIGIVLVLSPDGNIAGVFSERDAVRASFVDPEGFMKKSVTDLMTKNVIFVEPSDDIEYVESIMTGNKIRHLPVVENKRLMGLISIGDLVKSLLTKSQFENKYLQDYISGNLIG